MRYCLYAEDGCWFKYVTCISKIFIFLVFLVIDKQSIWRHHNIMAPEQSTPCMTDDSAGDSARGRAAASAPRVGVGPSGITILLHTGAGESAFCGAQPPLVPCPEPHDRRRVELQRHGRRAPLLHRISMTFIMIKKKHIYIYILNTIQYHFSIRILVLFSIFVVLGVVHER